MKEKYYKLWNDKAELGIYDGFYGYTPQGKIWYLDVRKENQ
jgi:hypothetical protein